MKTTRTSRIVTRRQQKGVTMIEYALIAALIAVAALVTVTALGGDVSAKFGAISTALQ